MQRRPIHHPLGGQANPPRVRRVGRRAALATLGLLALPRAGLAQGDPWTVRGVSVDVSGSDAVAARERALADGTRQAWEQLLGRIATPERAAALRTLPVPEIEALAEGVEIEDERVAPNRYRATMTVAFSAERVRTRLAEAGGAAGGGGGGPVPARASFRGVRQWGELMRRLESSVAVARVDLQALRVAEADLVLLLTDAPARAAEALAVNGVRLEPDPAGGPWRLRLAAP